MHGFYITDYMQTDRTTGKGGDDEQLKRDPKLKRMRQPTRMALLERSLAQQDATMKGKVAQSLKLERELKDMKQRCVLHRWTNN